MPKVRFTKEVQIGVRTHVRGSIADVSDEQAADLIARGDGSFVADAPRAAVSPTATEARKAVKLGG